MSMNNKIIHKLQKIKTFKLSLKTFNKWRNLQQLMFLFSTSIIVVSMSFMMGYNIINIKNILNTNFKKWSIEVAINMKKSCLNGLIIEDSRAVKQSIENIFDESTVVYAAIYNKNGNIIIENSRYKDNYHQYKKKPVTNLKMSDKTYANKNVLEIKSLIYQNKTYYGYIVILFSKSQINEKMSNVLINNIINVCVFLIFGIFISYFIAKSIASPLKKITLHMDELANGNYNKKVPNELFNCSDEIMKLAKAIKVMQNRTNTFLKQKQLLEKEKLTALGQLVNGVAHEVNTPVGVNITTISCLINKTNAIQQLLDDKRGIKKSEITEYIRVNKELDHIIYTNLKKIADIISTFKRVAVDQTIEEKRTFKVNSYIEQILLAISPQIFNSKVKINIICNPNLEILSYPGSIYQILSNLIINSFKHAFDNVENATISITVEKKDDLINLIYKDNGKGIPDEYISKVFDPFFTTKRSETSGLGLFLVYNIITHLLLGTIECNSVENEGVEFKIVFRIDS